jgi:hypothetical protein
LFDETSENFKENGLGIKKSSVDYIKSSVNMYFRLMFNINSMNCEANRLLSKNLAKKYPKLPKYKFIWDLRAVFGSLKSLNLSTKISNNQILLIEYWQRKVTVLLAIYCLLRPQEINVIVDDNTVFEKDGLWVNTIIKTDNTHLRAIFIPSTNGEEDLNPMRATQGLKITCQFYMDTTHLFVSPYTGLILTIYKTKQYIRDLMRLAKIPEMFGVYSIKNSTIAYLLSKGISEDVINKIARYSLGSTMVSKQYAVSQDQKNGFAFIADLVVKSEILKDKVIDSSAHFTEFYGNENPEFVESKTINDSLHYRHFIILQILI